MLDVINSTNKKTMAEIALMSDSNEVKIWQYWILFFSTYTELIVWNPNLCQFCHLIRICDKGCIYSKFYLYFYNWKIFQNSLHPKSRVFFLQYQQNHRNKYSSKPRRSPRNEILSHKTPWNKKIQSSCSLFFEKWNLVGNYKPYSDTI